MLPEFLHLSSRDQAQILETAALTSGLAPHVLEKDVWVCQTLAMLFDNVRHGPTLAFKGGTSLSKVYRAIERFSEDIDLTIDNQHFGVTDLSALSNNDTKRLRKEIDSQVGALIHDFYAPLLCDSLVEKGIDQLANVTIPLNSEVPTDQHVIEIEYQSAVSASKYVRNVVKLEFGGRGQASPVETTSIATDLASILPTGSVTFPEANSVSVLIGERTFWEKATLAHAESNRGHITTPATRMSRHWYDLAQLAEHPIGHRALNRIDLLREVVQLKSVFFSRSTDNYEAFIAGNARLLPLDLTWLRALESDYVAMSREMIVNAPTWSEIVNRITTLEGQVNTAIRRMSN